MFARLAPLALSLALASGVLVAQPASALDAPALPTSLGVYPSPFASAACRTDPSDPLITGEDEPAMSAFPHEGAAPEGGGLRVNYVIERWDGTTWISAYDVTRPTEGWLEDGELAKLNFTEPVPHDTTYRVRARTWWQGTVDTVTTDLYSEFSPWCYFHVDPTGPSRPQIAAVEGSTYTICGATTSCPWEGGPGIAGKFRISPSEPGKVGELRGYQWRLSGGEWSEVSLSADQAGAGGVIEIEATPATFGTKSLAVVAVDWAGRSSATTYARINVAPPPPPPPLPELESSQPTISGVAAVGRTLVADPGTWSPDGAEFSYYWTADGKWITGTGSGNTLVLPPSVLGKRISVQTSGHLDGYEWTASAESEPTAPVALGTMLRAKPRIVGSVAVGTPVSVDPGTWGPTKVHLTYRWYANDRALPGQTAKRFVLDPGLFRRRLSVRVTATSDGYLPATRVSSSRVVVPGRLDGLAPRIAGKARVGRQLSAVSLSSSPWPSRVRYQWYSGHKAIKGARWWKFRITKAYLHKRLRLRVTYMRPGYRPDAVMSAPTARVKRRR